MQHIAKLATLNPIISSLFCVFQELFRQLPQQRKLSLEDTEEAIKLLSLKANKKMVQNKLAKRSGKVVLLKDLSNLSARIKAGTTRNNLTSAVQQLAQKYG